MTNVSSENDGHTDNTTDRPQDVSAKDFIEHQVAVMIWKICPPFILVLGSFGNIATICVMRRIKDHNSSVHAILISLAVSDLTVLYTAMLRYWLMYVFGVDVVLLHASLCKLRNFLVYVVGLTSALLVTCVTVQRTMAVLWPHKMRVMCTVRRTWIVIAVIVLSMCALNFHLLIGLDLSEEEGCHTLKGAYQRFYYQYFSLIDLLLASFFPSVCMIVCDIILSVSLFKAVSASSSSIAARNESTNSSSAHSTDSRKKTSYRTTVMILALSCAFLFLTLPYYVKIVWNSYNLITLKENPQAKAIDALAQAITYHMWYINSSVNFVLYCLTGTKFRREFLLWIRCGAQSPSAPSVHETASEASRGGRHKHPGNRPLSK